nr:hypothetical protein [Tanacetum cinerariifolium]
MDQQNPTLAKIPILDTGKFEQWQFRIRQYLQHEHYALWEGRTVALTTEDMQKRKNDVKARTTLLLALPDEHQLRFSKYKTVQELWAAILKTFGAKDSSGKEDVNTASIPTASTNVSPASVNIRAVSISQDTACAYIASQSSGKKISIQGTDVAGFDKSKVECFDYHKMGHFARECRAPRSQDRGRRDNYRQGSQVEEHAPKALMVIDGVGWDWSFMANEEEDHALVTNEEAPIEFTLMAKTSAESEVCHRIENLTNELETLKKEKEGLESKLTGFKSDTKDLDNLIGSQRSVKIKEGLGYSVVPPPAQVYSPLKKDMYWTGLPEFADDTITDYTRPFPSVESNPNDLQNSSSSASENGESTGGILSKPEIKFVRPADSLTVAKSDKKETVRKPSIKYAELYRKPTKRSNVRGNKRN